ncbi:MAG: STAS domain-containing protein, partial [Planctomycetota bacterium]
GRATFRNVSQLQDAIGRLIDAGEPFILADLSQVVKLDSSWLGELVACRERVRKHGGTLKVIARGRCRDLFVTSGLDRLFEIYTDEEAALDRFLPECSTAGVP